MQVTQTSLLTGKKRTREIPVSILQMQQWMNGALIQTVMPDLTPDQREFIKTGITPEEWDTLLK
jgi:hypothetical protein